jgi:hypothetical protein
VAAGPFDQMTHHVKPPPRAGRDRTVRTTWLSVSVPAPITIDEWSVLSQWRKCGPLWSTCGQRVRSACSIGLCAVGWRGRSCAYDHHVGVSLCSFSRTARLRP